MHSARMKTSDIALAVLCAALVLMQAAPKAVLADSRVQTVETAQGVSSICAEPSRPVFVVQPLGTYLSIADQRAPVSQVAAKLQPEEIVRADLRMPAALLQTLLLEEGISRNTELHVPAALLVTLSAEGRMQMLQRRQDLCTPFFSLY